MTEFIPEIATITTGPAYFQISCQNCRKSHRKCDRLLPNCIECTKRNLECSYLGPKKRSKRENISSATKHSPHLPSVDSTIVAKSTVPFIYEPKNFVQKTTFASSTSSNIVSLPHSFILQPSTPQESSSLQKRKLEEENSSSQVANSKKIHFTDPFASNNGNNNIILVTSELAESLLRDSSQLQLCTSSMNSPLFRSHLQFQDILHAFMDEMTKGFYYVTKEYIFNLLPSKEREDTLLAKKQHFDYKVNRAIWYSLEALALLFVKNENTHVATLFYELAVRYVMDPDVYFEAENSFKLACALVNLSHLSAIDPHKVKRAFVFNRNLRLFLSKQEEKESKGQVAEEEQKQSKAIWAALIKAEFVADIVDYHKYCQTPIFVKFRTIVDALNKFGNIRTHNFGTIDSSFVREYEQSLEQTFTSMANTLEQSLHSFSCESFHTMESVIALYDSTIQNLGKYSYYLSKMNESQSPFLVLLYSFRLDIIYDFCQCFETHKNELDKQQQVELEDKYKLAKRNAADQITKILCSDDSWNKLRLHSFIQTFAMRASQAHLDDVSQHQYYYENEERISILKGDLWVLQECSLSNPAYDVREDLAQKLHSALTNLELTTLALNAPNNPFSPIFEFSSQDANLNSSEWERSNVSDSQLHQEEDNDLLQQKLLDLIEPMFQNDFSEEVNTSLDSLDSFLQKK